MNFTVKKVEQDIAVLERRLEFLRQLLAYLRASEVPERETTITNTTPAPATVGMRVGMRATILRKLADGAAFPEDLMGWFPIGSRKSVQNAIAGLRRGALIRDTNKGRIELTTQGLAEAQWFVAHPGLSKRGKGKPSA